jgi:hypothetical protein
VLITTTGASAENNPRVNYTVTATGRIGYGIKKNPNYNVPPNPNPKPTTEWAAEAGPANRPRACK